MKVLSIKSRINIYKIPRNKSLVDLVNSEVCIWTGIKSVEDS